MATTPPKRRYFNAMHLSVVCPEEMLHSTPRELEAASDGSFMPSDRGLEYHAACRAWGVPTLDAASLAPIDVAVPTLIVSGAMDPITPPRWGPARARWPTSLWTSSPASV